MDIGHTCTCILCHHSSDSAKSSMYNCTFTHIASKAVLSNTNISLSLLLTKGRVKKWPFIDHAKPLEWFFICWPWWPRGDKSHKPMTQPVALLGQFSACSQGGANEGSPCIHHGVAHRPSYSVVSTGEQNLKLEDCDHWSKQRSCYYRHCLTLWRLHSIFFFTLRSVLYDDVQMDQ